MNDLSNLPYSARKQLEDARRLAEQDRPEVNSAIRHAAAELARSKPEVCALVIAAQQGYTELTLTETEVTYGYQVIPKVFLGIDMGSSVKQVKTTRVLEKHWRLT
jgi:hypothetical protein